MTDDEQPQAPLPRPGALLFAAAFVIAMFYNLYWDAQHADYSGERLTIFFGAAALLVLGVDVGKIWGRK